MAAPIKKVVFVLFRRNFCPQRTFSVSQALFKKVINRNPGKPKFIDTKRILLKTGPGGSGIAKFGGVGGRGGHVYVKVDGNKTSLKDMPDRLTSETGENARKTCLIGPNGRDKVILVPPGVNIRCAETGQLIGDLDEADQEVLVLEGGKGGDASSNFLPQKGNRLMMVLDLKIIADVGLLGFPNAGKSTFLEAISNAEPKIAAYPFTTLQPQIGTMEFSDYRQITVADLPGLIEGSHLNYGKGHRFLKHIERTKLLLMIVDVFGFQLSINFKHRTAFETILLLNRELEMYNPGMLGKPVLLALNKIDLDDGAKTETMKTIELVRNLPDSLYQVDPQLRPKDLLQFDGIFTMSAKNRDFVDNVKNTIRDRLDYYAQQEAGWDERDHEAQKFDVTKGPFSEQSNLRLT